MHTSDSSFPSLSSVQIRRALRELFQKAEVVLIEVPDVIDAVEEHRQALETHAEGVAAPDFGIVAHTGEHRGINHAAAANLDPFLLHLREMIRTQVHFETWFGVTKIMRTETRLGVPPQQRCEDVIEQRLQ